MSEKYSQIISLFEQHRNEKQAEAMAAYMKNHFRFFGIGSKQRKALEKDIFKNECILPHEVGYANSLK